MSTYGTSTMNGITIASGSLTPSAPVPKALIATRAVELKDGWVGQVIVANEVVAEKSAFQSSHDAQEWADDHVAKRLRKLFAA